MIPNTVLHPRRAGPNSASATGASQRRDDELASAADQGDDAARLDNGDNDVRRISNVISIDLVDVTDRYATPVGYLFWKLGDLPSRRAVPID